MISVFFDMDGVIADFVRGALAVHMRKDVPISDVPWGLEEKLGIEPRDFWKPMGFDFWSSLSVLHDGMRLLSLVESVSGRENVALLTSACDENGCFDGKRLWLRNHLPRYAKSLFTGSEKFKIAGPTKILVDDNDENCRTWTDAGGLAVLVPRPWNALKQLTDTDGGFDVEQTFRCFVTKYVTARSVEP